jgi:hypothetical protein
VSNHSYLILVTDHLMHLLIPSNLQSKRRWRNFLPLVPYTPQGCKSSRGGHFVAAIVASLEPLLTDSEPRKGNA